MAKIFRSKTTWVAIASLATVAGAYFNGDVSLGQALQVAVMSLFGVTLRDTISNVGR